MSNRIEKPKENKEGLNIEKKSLIHKSFFVGMFVGTLLFFGLLLYLNYHQKQERKTKITEPEYTEREKELIAVCDTVWSGDWSLFYVDSEDRLMEAAEFNDDIMNLMQDHTRIRRLWKREWLENNPGKTHSDFAKYKFHKAHKDKDWYKKGDYTEVEEEKE